jgi:tyrosine-protein kinase Etk/Wzc
MQTQNNKLQNTQNSQVDDDEINLMDILLVIAKYNRFILAFTAVSAALAFVYALKQPILYSSNALIMPPQAPMSQTSMLMGQLSSLGLGAGVSSASGSGASIGILIKSQKLAYQVVKRLDLQSLYKVKNIEAARNVLATVTKVTVNNKEGTTLIECFDKDPKMAALIVETYVEELDRLNTTIAITSASRTRLYLEKQLKSANETLANIELSLKESQKNTDLTPLELQTGSMANLITTLRMQITAKEMELTSLRSYATEKNPQYRMAVTFLGSLRSQLQKLESDNEMLGKRTSGMQRPLKTGSEFLNNMRELKYQQALTEMLKKQYDMAKMDEAKNANLIQVVNEPLVPESPSRPRRGLIVAVGASLGLILSIVFAFIMNALDTANQNPKSVERLNLLRRYLKLGK